MYGNQQQETEENCTTEETEAINRVLLQQDGNYYGILGLQLFSSEEDVKRAYKQLSLQLHPDKNKAPRAEEAFKVMQNAYLVLIDTEKKDRYDTEQRQRQERLRQQQRAKYQYTGRARPSQYQFQATTRSGHSKTDEDFMRFVLMFGIPILILLLYPVFCHIFQTEELFALRKRGPFTEQRLTSINRIPYYVRKGYQPETLNQYHNLEEQVEKKYDRLYF